MEDLGEERIFFQICDRSVESRTTGSPVRTSRWAQLQVRTLNAFSVSLLKSISIQIKIFVVNELNKDQSQVILVSLKVQEDFENLSRERKITNISISFLAYYSKIEYYFANFLIRLLKKSRHASKQPRTT